MSGEFITENLKTITNRLEAIGDMINLFDKMTVVTNYSSFHDICSMVLPKTMKLYTRSSTITSFRPSINRSIRLMGTEYDTMEKTIVFEKDEFVVLDIKSVIPFLKEGYTFKSKTNDCYLVSYDESFNFTLSCGKFKASKFDKIVFDLYYHHQYYRAANKNLIVDIPETRNLLSSLIAVFHLYHIGVVPDAGKIVEINQNLFNINLAKSFKDLGMNFRLKPEDSKYKKENRL